MMVCMCGVYCLGVHFFYSALSQSEEHIWITFKSALQWGLAEFVELLDKCNVERFAEPLDNTKNTALHVVSRRGDVAMVRAVLNKQQQACALKNQVNMKCVVFTYCG